MEYKKYFITFGAGTPGYNNRVKVLANQANELKWFDYVIGYNGTDLVADNIFWSTHGNFILKNKRGLGYWLWKSYLIKKTLEKMNENDVLLYCDVGCELNQHGKTKLDEYYNIVSNPNNSGLLNFQMEGLFEYQWNKSDLFDLIGSSTDDINSGQIHATTFFIRKCEKTINIINEWYNISCNYHMISDSPSIIPNHPQFRDHRHDQSILSLLLKKNNTDLIKDETFFYPNWESGKDYPIWAKRIRS